MCLIGGRLLRSCADSCRGRCIESTLLQNLTLHLLISLLGDFESIIKAFRVEDSLCVLRKLIAKQSTLLVLVLRAHVSSLVYVGRGSTIERSIVLIDVILRGCLGAVEPGKVGAEVGILTHAGTDTEASRRCPGATWHLAILDRSSLIHRRGVTHVSNIVEGLVRLRELPGVRRLLA